MQLRLPFLVLFAASAAFAQDPGSPPVPRDGDEAAIEALERRTGSLTRRVARSVVSVAATESAAGPQEVVLPGLRIVPPRNRDRLEAAGFFVEPGVVVTTSDIVRAAGVYEVRCADGRRRPATLAGSDDVFRIAVLRVDELEHATPISAPSPGPAAGARALAWLATPCELAAADLSVVVVRGAACTSSSYDRHLAASICLQPGGAGAPLVGADGRLLGMAVASTAPSPVQADGSVRHCRSTLFVRGDDVISAAREILASRTVRHARLGVMLDAGTNRVDQLVPGGPAERAGLLEADEIVAVAGQPVTNATDISRVLLRRTAGEAIPVETRRAGATHSVPVVIDDVGLPPLPSAPPVPGATLRWTWRDASGDTPAAQWVVVEDVHASGAAAAAGLAAGDNVVEIDGMPVVRYLTRHRVRPAAVPPSSVVVKRAAGAVQMTLRAR